ncbi:MAG: hypothetical protein EZS28_015963 [Streblomastix strix]|uniref:Uncharacterized protein n=1 Tax=Streblomastix strix TaxID=222440 RepID=A0A5J4W143_9EUKA|nr:MAG: hypothetical protein EZS28_015963 [Streblomastix strix]
MNIANRKSKIDQSDSVDNQLEELNGQRAQYRPGDEEGQKIGRLGGLGVGSGQTNSEKIKMGEDWRGQKSYDGILTQLDIKTTTRRTSGKEYSSQIQRLYSITPGKCRLSAIRIESGYSN